MVRLVLTSRNSCRSMMHSDMAHSSLTRLRTPRLARVHSSSLRGAKNRLPVETSHTSMFHFLTIIAAGRQKWMRGLKMAVHRMSYNKNLWYRKVHARSWNKRRTWRMLAAVPFSIDLFMNDYTRLLLTSNSSKGATTGATRSAAPTPTHLSRLSALIKWILAGVAIKSAASNQLLASHLCPSSSSRPTLHNVLTLRQMALRARIFPQTMGSDSTTEASKSAKIEKLGFETPGVSS